MELGFGLGQSDFFSGSAWKALPALYGKIGMPSIPQPEVPRHIEVRRMSHLAIASCGRHSCYPMRGSHRASNMEAGVTVGCSPPAQRVWS